MHECMNRSQSTEFHCGYKRTIWKWGIPVFANHNFDSISIMIKKKKHKLDYRDKLSQSEWKVQTHFGGRLMGECGVSLSSSFFSRGSRGGRILGRSFSSRFIRSLSHSSFLRILSFSRSLSLSLSRSLCRRSLSRWSLSRSRSRGRSRGSRVSRSRSCRGSDACSFLVNVGTDAAKMLLVI